MILRFASFICCYGAHLGGAVNIEFSTVSVEESTFTSASTEHYGGGVYAYASTVTARSLFFTGCSAAYGGSVGSQHSLVTVDATRFTNNKGSSGDVYVNTGTVRIRSSTFTGTTGGLCAGIYAEKTAEVTVESSEFDSLSSDAGGAIQAIQSHSRDKVKGDSLPRVLEAAL